MRPSYGQRARIMTRIIWVKVTNRKKKEKNSKNNEEKKTKLKRKEV